ncbi:unnamed protein product [Leptidea sinapis]|uniref:Fatty acid desaturase domain-containing protein n=1 Tax=Leptidea sinapis TaxID=189913 RepID=A0A5E4QA75_9NEOP|nr:unnamed protein product [Leptidea sinapis]
MAPNHSDGELLEQPFEDLEKLVPGRITPRKYVIDYPHVALFDWLIFVLASVGVTAGAHRLWSHRAFKAKLPLQILLMVMQTLSFQRTVAHWVRDHRLHHRYSDTDADPHNASRGFFFSHIGWLLVKEHEEVEKRIKHVDMSDILTNPVLKFQYE